MVFISFQVSILTGFVIICNKSFFTSLSVISTSFSFINLSAVSF
ncbi:MAG: hypothetical protein Q8S84_06285 [bacterium]|nr:hypothetical protein [bacterium]MDP3381082.1 hypothetical protein [bacterium]